jgi:hypothetical protein
MGAILDFIIGSQEKLASAMNNGNFGRHVLLGTWSLAHLFQRYIYIAKALWILSHRHTHCTYYAAINNRTAPSMCDYEDTIEKLTTRL